MRWDSVSTVVVWWRPHGAMEGGPAPITPGPSHTAFVCMQSCSAWTASTEKPSNRASHLCLPNALSKTCCWVVFSSVMPYCRLLTSLSGKTPEELPFLPANMWIFDDLFLKCFKFPFHKCFFPLHIITRCFCSNHFIKEAVRWVWFFVLSCLIKSLGVSIILMYLSS